MRVNATLASLQSARGSYAYGQLARTPMQSGAKRALVRSSIPDDIPDDATITKADLVFYVKGALTGSRTFTAQAIADSWSVSRATWNTSPAVTSVARAVTVGAVADGFEVRIPVAADVQQFVSGALKNRGFRLITSDASLLNLYGSTASKLQPWIDLEYVETLEAPSDLSPNDGAVSFAAPTLTFSVPEDTTAVRVWIDAAGDFALPDWDSGWIPSTVGLLDLTTAGAPLYPGLSLGASTSWCAFARTPAGDSDPSDVASFSRTAKPAVTITSPGATTGDKTPPITWTAPGQVSWRAQLLDGVTGEIIDDSKMVTSSETEWTPTKGLKKVGDVGRARVQVWDAVQRIATPGDPIYSEATFDFTLVATSAAPGADSLMAVQIGPSPVVRLAWSGATPDMWQVTRDGRWIDRIDGAETTFYDYGATPLTQHVYQVLSRTDTGDVSPNGPTATITPRLAGAWLMDPDSGKKVLILDAQVDSTMTDRAVLHNVIGDKPVIRRRSGTPPPSGTLSGFLIDGLDEDFSAGLMLDHAVTFKGNDQGTVYRLAFDGWNIPVTIGDLSWSPAGLDDGRATYAISFAWWQTDDEIPWEG